MSTEMHHCMATIAINLLCSTFVVFWISTCVHCDLEGVGAVPAACVYKKESLPHGHAIGAAPFGRTVLDPAAHGNNIEITMLLARRNWRPS